MGIIFSGRREYEQQRLYGKTQMYYHYTSLSTAWAILKGECLWASHARFSNDSEELKNGMELMKTIIKDEYTNDKTNEPLIDYLDKLHLPLKWNKYYTIFLLRK